MTEPTQFAQDGGDLVAVITIVWLVVGAIAWWAERRMKREHRSPDVLPPPQDGRDHNDELIADWKKRKARIDRFA
jgi:hypothetical protein